MRGKAPGWGHGPARKPGDRPVSARMRCSRVLRRATRRA